MWEGTPDIPFADDVAPDMKAGGAIAVLAHPHFLADNDLERNLDALTEELMLDGIECAHPKVASERTPLLRSYCLAHGLVSTAGSDNHSAGGVRDRLGMHEGEQAWLDEFLERITV
jgi:predicted metal-dependent phosphoesterase TrpH